MSLATYAAPFNEDNIINNINNKPKSHCKVNTEKVNTLLSKIHDTFDEEDNLADFKPPPMPKSSGVQKRIDREGFKPKTAPEYSHVYRDKMDNYKPYVPNVHFNKTEEKIDDKNDDVINKKLNEIISLLREQQESRTEHVTEEIILYSFFGIFIIYLVDSFKRVGKYTR